MTWKQLSVITSKNTAPAISDLFSTLGAVSVTYMDAEDHPVYEPGPGETRIWNLTRVIGLFESDVDIEPVKSFISSQFDNIPTNSWRLEILEDQVWERTWLEHYQPMLFGRKLWVCPTGQEQSEPDTVCLTLDPGLAFGTGTHATTALCLEWLASNDLQGKTIIDYGCGSGILAIAGLLLGAKEAHAVDIDPQALTATQSNAEKNNVQDRINCYIPDKLPQIEADIVIANILAKPLIGLSDTISSLAIPHGHLVLSGILKYQADSVIQAYRPGFDILPPVFQEDWCLLEGIRD